MNKLQENMRRFGTKNLQEQNDPLTRVVKAVDQRNPALYRSLSDLYADLKSGRLDAKRMAEILKRSDQPAISFDRSPLVPVDHLDGSGSYEATGIIFGNDAEAVIQSVFAAIKDKNMLNNIFKILNRTVEDYIDDVGDELYDKNYHKHKVLTVRQSLQKLGYKINLDNIGYVYGGGALG